MQSIIERCQDYCNGNAMRFEININDLLLRLFVHNFWYAKQTGLNILGGLGGGPILHLTTLVGFVASCDAVGASVFELLFVFISQRSFSELLVVFFNAFLQLSDFKWSSTFFESVSYTTLPLWLPNA